MSWLRRFAARLSGTAELPADFAGALTADEQVLAAARCSDGPLVATDLGLWLPGGRRLGWHLISKATWNDGVLVVVEAAESVAAGEAVLLRDLPPSRFPVTEPGRLPEVVHARVTGSIRGTEHRELAVGGARFVRRKVPGRDGLVLQVRPDPGTDEAALVPVAEEVARRLRRPAP
ncbi:hypothetical protein ACL03H_09335 [Saccharopolyspora sp. MS10]|uniref:hypothetical protein n=1 Tax=Saccharopolyspora sp. MS10 TaxID=3385973 RepID=UPI0039A318BA